MQKITNLHRLDFNNKMMMLRYLAKRILKLKTSEKERQINEYYFHLISFKGFLIKENDQEFHANYPDLGITVKIRKRPSSDLNVFAQIYQEEEYKPLVAVFKSNFPNAINLNIIDAGCNIGLATLYLSNFFQKSNFIILEPDTSNFESITSNFESNNITNTTKIRGGLWSVNANLKIVNDFRDKNDWSFRVEATADETDLKGFSVSYLMEAYQLETIDILKIDIEGSEKELFLGVNADVSYLTKVKCIAIEIHDELQCRAAIYKILKDFNFDFFESGDLTIGINQNFLIQ